MGLGVAERLAVECQKFYIPSMGDLIGFGTIGLVDALPEELRKALFSAGTPVTYQDGETIHHRGDAEPGLSVVRKGVVRMGNYTVDGDYIVTVHLTPGDCFGEFTLFAGVPRTHHAQAMGVTVVDQISKAAFDRVLGSNPEFRQSLLAVVTTRLYASLEFIEEMRSLPLDVRAAKMLLRAVPPEASSAQVTLTQDQLAGALGVTRVSVNKCLREFEQLDLIERHYGKINVPDVAALTDWVTQRMQIEPLPLPTLGIEA